MTWIPKTMGMNHAGKGVSCGTAVSVKINTGNMEAKPAKISSTHSQVCLNCCASLKRICPDGFLTRILLI